MQAAADSEEPEKCPVSLPPTTQSYKILKERKLESWKRCSLLDPNIMLWKLLSIKSAVRFDNIPPNFHLNEIKWWFVTWNNSTRTLEYHKKKPQMISKIIEGYLWNSEDSYRSSSCVNLEPSFSVTGWNWSTTSKKLSWYPPLTQSYKFLKKFKEIVEELQLVETK
jgi:hypothetical protein